MTVRSGGRRVPTRRCRCSTVTWPRAVAAGAGQTGGDDSVRGVVSPVTHGRDPLIGWLDCAAGASGDMFLGVLVDAGVPIDVLQASVDAVNVEPVRLRAEHVSRHGLAATRVHVECPDSDVDRRFPAIRELITSAALPQPVRDAAVEVFTRLGEAEAAAHGVALEDVHFHEVAALDSLADVVAGCAGFHWLRQERGLTTITASTVTVGGGVTRGAHGGIPLPAPATLSVLSRAQAPVAGEVPYEACTPTGAALIAAHATGYEQLPAMTVQTVAVGAGGRDPAERANVLRLVLGSPATNGRPTATVMEANVDDMDPRLWPQALAALFDAGASDAWLSPIQMKKGRPAHTLHVLCPNDKSRAVRAAVFASTTTIGLRSFQVDKVALDRAHTTVTVNGCDIAVKLAIDDGRIVNVSVEHEDVVAAAARLSRPVKVVQAQAIALAANRYEDE
jgi:uncharacterized protein (TIGR00299 family) protein